MPQKKQWIVVTSGDRPLDEVAKALEKKGFTIDSKLEAIGQLIGSATEAERKDAKSIKGITDIQASFDVNIGPPDAEVTW